MRDFLIYIASRDGTFRGDFFGADRNYDVAVNRWGQGTHEPTEQEAAAEYRFSEVGEFSPALHANIVAGRIPRDYRAYALFCDDLETDTTTVNRCFTLGIENKLNLWMPALSESSLGVGWPFTVVQPGGKIRPVPFIEDGRAFFSNDAFWKCWRTLGYTQSGWGPAFLWSRLVGHQGIACLDSLVVHSAAAAQAFCRRMPNGKTAVEECMEFCRKYNVRGKAYGRFDMNLYG